MEEEDDEGAGLSGDEEGGDARELDAYAQLLFSSDRWRRLWPAWLPRLQLEVVRRRPIGAGEGGALHARSVADERVQLRELFPSLPEAALRRELLRHGTMEMAVEQLLDAGDGDAREPLPTAAAASIRIYRPCPAASHAVLDYW